MMLLLWSLGLFVVECANIKPTDKPGTTQKVAFVIQKSQGILALIIAACTFIVLVIVLVDLMFFSRRYRRQQEHLLSRLIYVTETQTRYQPRRIPVTPTPRPRSGISDGTFIVSTNA